MSVEYLEHHYMYFSTLQSGSLMYNEQQREIIILHYLFSQHNWSGTGRHLPTCRQRCFTGVLRERERQREKGRERQRERERGSEREGRREREGGREREGERE